MIVVKLSEIKVGDKVNDIKNTDSFLCTTLEVVKIKDGGVFFKEIAGFKNGYIDEDGLIRFSTFSNEIFYKL